MQTRLVAPIIFKLSFEDLFLCSVRYYFWRRVHRSTISIGGLYVRWLCSVRLAYCHANRLIMFLYKAETEDEDKIKKQTDIDRHDSRLTFKNSQPPDPLIFHYTLTTFKVVRCQLGISNKLSVVWQMTDFECWICQLGKNTVWKNTWYKFSVDGPYCKTVDLLTNRSTDPVQRQRYFHQTTTTVNA